MLIIDEQARERFIHALRAHPDPEGSHCMHFRLSGYKQQDLRESLIRSARLHLAGQELQLFCDEDGDMYLLVDDVPTRESKRIILDTAALLQIEPAERAADLYDLGVEISALILKIEKKIEKQREALEATKKDREKLQAECKRLEILQAVAADRTQDVDARRRRREQPELMIIEDDPFSRRLVENTLQRQYRLTKLASAEDALATYADLAPNLLFLDINLPDVTGHELLERIIAMDPNAYVVMLSGNSDRDNVMQAMSRGAKGFVAKPFTRDKLFQYIERCPTIRKENLQ